MSVVGVSAYAGQYTCEHGTFRGGRRAVIWDMMGPIESIADDLRLPYRESHPCCGPFFARVHDELAFSDHLTRRTIDRYLANPRFFARCVAENSVGFWALGRDAMMLAVSTAIQLPFLLFAAWGAWSVWRRRVNLELIVVLLFVTYFVAVHLPIAATARYAVPLIPIISLFAAAGVIQLFTRRAR